MGTIETRNGSGDVAEDTVDHSRLSELTVHTASSVTRLQVSRDFPVRDALDATDLRVRAACGGTGSCGACQVRLLSGKVNPLTAAEFMKIGADERALGQRMACQLRLTGDAEIFVDDPAPASQWKSILPENLAPVTARMPKLEQYIYGVAVDLGTTYIRVAFWDRKSGRRIATRRGPNPQNTFGYDVLNRLDAAQAGPERAREISGMALDATVQAVRDILTRDVGEVTPMLAEIGRVVVVGNTAMLALATEYGSDALMRPDNWQRPIDYHPRDLAAWREHWYMPHAEIVVPGPVAGFVGSDLIANVIATRLDEGPTGSLLLDMGTNTEIALWDGETLHVTSVPGGPAFEGGSILYGMAAEPGAIRRVKTDQSARGFHCEVIGGGEAQGFCGSGLIDGIAMLLAKGIIKRSGRFVTSPGEEGFALDPDNPRTAITGKDIDTFQRAKAATAAAVMELLRQSDMDWSDITRLCVCGAFGHHLDIDHAQALGLLPSISSTLIELYADATLTGSELALLSTDGNALFERAARRAHLVNLSLAAEYEDLYINNLPLCSIFVSM